MTGPLLRPALAPSESKRNKSHAPRLTEMVRAFGESTHIAFKELTFPPALDSVFSSAALRDAVLTISPRRGQASSWSKIGRQVPKMFVA